MTHLRITSFFDLIFPAIFTLFLILSHTHTWSLFSNSFEALFAKLLISIISFIVSVYLFGCLPFRPSVRTERLGSYWTNFKETFFIWFFFTKICPENPGSMKIWQEYGILYNEDVRAFLIITHQYLLRMKFILVKFVVQWLSRHTLYSINFFLEIVPLMR